MRVVNEETLRNVNGGFGIAEQTVRCSICGKPHTSKSVYLLNSHKSTAYQSAYTAALMKANNCAKKDALKWLK